MRAFTPSTLDGPGAVLIDDRDIRNRTGRTFVFSNPSEVIVADRPCDVLPALSAAVAAADHATEDVRDEARRRGLAAAAALRGELEPPKKHHRIRNLLLVLGLGGVAAAVAKMLSDRQASTAWQSSYTPPPAPAAAPQGGNDEGGSTPDVAAADKQTEPHNVTTPENPAVEKDLTEKGE